MQRAVELGSGVPPILIRVAHFHFGRGENHAALDFTSRILQLISEYDGISFSYYYRFNISVSHLLSSGLPDEVRAQRSYFRHLLTWGAPDDAHLAWSALVTNSYVEAVRGRRVGGVEASGEPAQRPPEGRRHARPEEFDVGLGGLWSGRLRPALQPISTERPAESPLVKSWIACK